MPLIASNGIVLEVESQGPLDAPPILLIMGLGAQLVRWSDSLCAELLRRGYRVIRFDNRDCGLSSRISSAKMPRLADFLAGKFVPASALPYTLTDMARDGLGILDAFAIERAHLVGASMGAAIAQRIAAGFGGRALSLTSIMSSSGNPALPPPTAAATASLFAPLPLHRDRDSLIADCIARFRAVASPAYPTSHEELQTLFGREIDRGFDPAGIARQLAALLADGDRRPLLKDITCPTVVVHGADDPLIPPACGRDVAASIPGAELRIIPGMGHDFPDALSSVLADAIHAAAQRSSPASRQSTAFAH